MQPGGPPAPPSPRRRTGGVVGLVLAVVLIGWLVRLPGAGEDGDPTPDPVPTATTAPAALPTPRPPGGGAPALLGLDAVMPVIDGTWDEVAPPGAAADGTPRVAPPVAVWDGREVVVVDGPRARAWDPVADLWRDLPDVPLGGGPAVALSGVVVDGRVVVTDALAVAPVPADPEPARSWVLTAGGWQAVTSIPGDGAVIGAAGGRALVARTTGAHPDGVEVWAADPRAEAPERLPDLPVDVVDPRVAALPDGFVLLGATVTGGDGSGATPFRHEHVAVRWRDGMWSVIDLPALRPFATAGAAVDRPTSLLARPEGDGGLQLVGLAPGRPLLRLVGLDAAGLSTIDVEIPDRVAEVLSEATISLAWDTGDRVWLYGGYGSGVQLSVELSTGAVSAAIPTGGRVHHQAVWVDDALLLLGGFGPRGPVTTIHRWTPR